MTNCGMFDETWFPSHESKCFFVALGKNTFILQYLIDEIISKLIIVNDKHKRNNKIIVLFNKKNYADETYISLIS